MKLIKIINNITRRRKSMALQGPHQQVSRLKRHSLHHYGESYSISIYIIAIISHFASVLIYICNANLSPLFSSTFIMCFFFLGDAGCQASSGTLWWRRRKKSGDQGLNYGNLGWEKGAVPINLPVEWEGIILLLFYALRLAVVLLIVVYCNCWEWISV